MIKENEDLEKDNKDLNNLLRTQTENAMNEGIEKAVKKSKKDKKDKRDKSEKARD